MGNNNMSTQFWFLKRGDEKPYESILLVVAGGIMCISGLLPWLTDPLKGDYTAWNISLDLGWQLRLKIVNYGVLCFFCAIYVFLVAYASWKPFKGSQYFFRKYRMASVICLLPLVLFFLQYLSIDMRSINDLAQHKVQVLLMQKHFGYNGAPDRITQQPFAVNSSTLMGRLVLLVNQMAIGICLPLISTILLIECSRFFISKQNAYEISKKSRNIWVIMIIGLIILLGRGPAAMCCDYESQLALSDGNYTQALTWLSWAHTLNPSLDQVASYHIQRGEALYFLNAGQQNDDSRAYLASVYRTQKNYLGAYEELLGALQSERNTPWVIDEVTTTLEYLSEYTKNANGIVAERIDHDHTALAWLQLLAKVDPSDVYGQYMVGRIEYDLHNYAACMNSMSIALGVSKNADIQSSAYTYIALSDTKLGKYTEARVLLLKAIKLDPNYRNNTAREDLSGLH